ncbi:type IA DNA topoisomerase [Reichenbachiella sp. MSK19-1]|uniref:type IA DNA topoisomerase n=1 Tax=Reichenbachiella sp. MSK19-1 TaxID=1897631 RepID=UPI000E6D3019|nr:type IA DNA topoisomerase [Reichenbachiella sp. MSK19-1]RJE74760.1 DNA topoisomerase III [Reichenbachiella sp. MSK19-1]
MKVCIAEKPSVAREIAHVIGAKDRHEGYFEGNGYQVTWTFGHFCTLYPPEDYKPHWKRWDLNTLPMLPERFETKVMDDTGVKKQFRVIKQLLDKADTVINCGDAGQEGELIQRWVIKEAQFEGEVQRLWISSLTTEAIRAGFEQLKPAEEFDNLYYAGSSRAIGDWLLGMNATRLYTLKYGGFKQVLSIGRVQTPTLAMLVNRHYEIENFQPKPYWELQTVYRETKFNNTTGKFHTKEDGEKLLNQISGKDLQITAIERKDGKEYAPKLFDLTSVQVYCNSKFGFTAESTLKMVQSLYEMKVVTYPRVDTTFLPNDMYPKITGILQGLTNYAQYTGSLIGHKIRKSPKVFNDNKVTDHHAIIPTGEEKPLSADQQKVYDIIVRRFIAVFYPDCKVAKTQVDAAVEKVTFVARGKEILEEGWRVLFPKEKKSKEDEDGKEEEEESILPTFEQGEQGPHEPSFIEKTTKPPKNYTEASLLRAMETAGKQVEDDELRDLMKANGIGRPSTRANIIETLFRRKYTERRKKQVVPTVMGIQLIDTIQNELLKSAELTGLWEKQLKEIEQGEYSAGQFIINMKKMVDELVYEVRMETGKPRLATESEAKAQKKTTAAAAKTGLVGMTCPKCKQGRILKGKQFYGCSAFKAGCDLRLPFKYLDKKLTEKQLQRLVEKKVTTKLKGFVLEGEKVDGIIKLTDTFELTFENKAPVSLKPKQEAMPPCPKCKKGTLIKGQTAYGCSRWKEGCDFRFAFGDIKTQANGRKLTKELVIEIIQQ